MCTDADSHIPPPPLPWPFVAQVIVWQYHDCWEQDERWTLSKPQEYSPAQLQKIGVAFSSFLYRLLILWYEELAQPFSDFF